MTDIQQSKLKRIAEKIAKLLALAASDNPTESATAKRQAQAMMDKYNLTSNDVAASQVNEQHSKTGSKNNPPPYICGLASIIAKTFGCEVILSPGGGWLDSQIKFLGVGIKPELAGYTFDVLRRQIGKDRTAYIGTLKRYKPKNKTSMADTFCNAWCWRISQQVQEFAGTEQELMAIAAYKQKKWGDSLTNNPRTRKTEQHPNAVAAIIAGANAARDVSLRKPVQSKRGALLKELG